MPIFSKHSFFWICASSLLVFFDYGVQRATPHKPTKKPPKTTNKGFWGDYPELQKSVISFMDTITHTTENTIVQLNLPLSGLLCNRYFIISCPKLAHEVLSDQSTACIKGDAAHSFRDKLFYPEGIIFMESTIRWNLLHQAFFSGPFNPKEFPNRYSQVFQDNFLWLMQRWERFDGQPFDLYREITYYTMRTITQAFFHYQLSDEQIMSMTPAFKFILDYLQERETSLITMPFCVPTKKNRKFRRSLKTFKKTLKKIIAQAPEKITINEIEYPTILGILKGYQDPRTKKKLTQKEILSHVGTLFFAGHDTTANFLTMLIYQLIKRPEWHDRIKQEINQKLTHRPTAWFPMGALQDYTKFKNEVLRLYPSVPVISRDTTCKITIGQYVIPKKSTLIISLVNINKHPFYYHNPTLFNPDRVEPNNPDYTPHQFQSFVPFSTGSRRCLGQWFAQAEARSFIAQLLTSTVELELLDDHDEVQLDMTCTGLPNRTIWTRIRTLQTQKPNHSHSIKDHLFKIKQIKYENQARTIKTFRLAPPNSRTLPFAYHPGDHLEIFIKKNNNLTHVRHYSISSSPTDSNQWIEITVKKEPGDTQSRALHNDLTKGDIVTIRAPMDDGVRVSEFDPINRPIVLVSGGIGITPMISITRYLLAKQGPGQIYFVHSSKTPQTIAFYDELTQLEKNHANLHLIVTMTQCKHNDLWVGLKGRVSSNLLKKIPLADISRARIYLCGSTPMCKSLKSVLQEQCNIPSNAITTLSFGALEWAQTATNKFSLEDVAQHNSTDSAWIIINGIVYDITNYIDHHPGMDIITDYLGTDATQAFNAIPHSAQAKQLLSNNDIIKIKGILV